MPVNVDNVRAAPVQPTVGTEGRTQLTRPNYGGLLQAVADTGMGVAKHFQDKAEAKAFDAIIGEAEKAAEGTKVESFSANPPEDVAAARATAVEEETGIALDEGDRGALSAAASVGTRLNDAELTAPDQARKFNLVRIKELRKLVAARPHLAKEFRSLIYGDNNFITAAMESTNAQASAEAKARHESINKVRDMLVMAGNPEVANMTDNEVLVHFAKSGYAADVKRLDAVQREAATYKAIFESGQAVDATNTRRLINEGKAGLVRTTMTQLDAIANDPALDPAGKARAVEQVVLQRRMQIQAAMPWMSATQVSTEFKDVLEDIPNSYRMLASEGPEKQAAETRLAVVKAGVELHLEERYGKSTVEFISRIVANMQSSGVLANYNVIRDSAPLKQFLGALAAIENGDNTAADVRITNRSDQQVAQETEQNAIFVRRMLGGFDKLDENSRRATAHMLVNAINHPDNRRTDAGMDRLMTVLASPEFKPLADSPEWQDIAAGDADRAIGNYLRNLDEAVGRTLGPLEGKVQAILDEKGMLNFVPQPGLEPKERDKVARLNNRLRNAIMANANLHNQTPAEATRDFYDTYLSR